MLEAIRERAQGWFAWAIVILISVPFALWGINQYFHSGGDTTVAKIDGHKISQNDFRRAYSNQRRRLEEMMGKNFRPELIDEKQLREQVLNSLIDNEVMVEAALNRGYRITDEQVAQLIRNEPAFQRDGKFDHDLFERYLRNEGETADGFGIQLRNSMVRDQMEMALRSSQFATPQAVQQLDRLRNEQRAIKYFVVPVSRFTGSEPSSEQIASYYKENIKRFMTPERVRVAYLNMSAAEIAQKISPTDKQLHQRYEDQLAKFTTPEDRRVSHILVAVNDAADKAEDKAALAKARALRERLLKGASFAQLAKEDSDDPGSAKKGGDLGFIGHGIMDPTFEKAAYALKKGQISEPIRTPFGYHLIEVTDIRPAKIKSFSDVRDQLKRAIQQERADDEYYTESDKLANLTFEHPDNLVTAAEALGLKVKQSEWFTRTGAKTGIAKYSKVVNAAFSDDVLVDHNNSEPLEVGNNHVVVIRVLDHQPEAQRSLEQVRNEIVKILEQRTARQRTTQFGEKTVQKLSRGESIESVAKAENIDLRTPKPITRSDKDVAPQIRQYVFRMPKPKDGKPSLGGLDLSASGYAVIELTRIIEPKGTATVEDRKALQRALIQARGEDDVRNTVTAIRSEADVKVNPANF